MLNGLLANAGSETAVSIPEAALYALLGFATVFLGIAFLILVVWLVGKVMSATAKKEKVQKAKPEALETSPVAVKQDDLDEETVAIITAALMAYYVKENRRCEFTVKRIKRI